MTVRFLLDENITPRLQAAALRKYPQLDILRVGDPGAPPFQTSDAEILRWVEREQRLLVTRNRASMPGHVADHLAQGERHWGIFRVRPETSIRDLVELLYVVSEGSTSEEWQDVNGRT